MNVAKPDLAKLVLMEMALIYGDASPDRFTDSVLWDERVQGLMGKITVELDPELDRAYPEKRITIVEITTEDGNRVSRRVENARGEPEDPLSWDEIEDKFHSMAGNAQDEATRRKIIEFFSGLETLDDIRGLFPLLKATLG